MSLRDHRHSRCQRGFSQSILNHCPPPCNITHNARSRHVQLTRSTIAVYCDGTVSEMCLRELMTFKARALRLIMHTFARNRSIRNVNDPPTQVTILVGYCARQVYYGIYIGANLQRNISGTKHGGDSCRGTSPSHPAGGKHFGIEATLILCKDNFTINNYELFTDHDCFK